MPVVLPEMIAKGDSVFGCFKVPEAQKFHVKSINDNIPIELEDGSKY
jgi:hypothetical protein